MRSESPWPCEGHKGMRMEAENSLGKLERVDLRRAWAHEARDFTPWLSENLDLLSNELGIEKLELEGTEVQVHPFSADIVARRPQDGSRVLIENQLEDADLQHLGQVIAYLAGLEARIVVWVAKSFHEAHLSAVRWLNEHTADPFAFFAVRVSLVQIGDSQLAPVFDVLKRPNEWDDQVRQVARSDELSLLGNFRRDFWKYYAQRYPDDELPEDYAASYVRHRVEEMDFTVSQYLAQSGVGIYIPGGSWEQVKGYEDTLRAEVGVELGGPSSDYLALSTLLIDSYNRENWPQMVDWLHEKLCHYRRVLTNDMSGQPD